MNIRNVASEAPVPADRLAEAGVWIARLHGDDRNRAMEAGFREWLEAHPLNQRAFELATNVWEESLNLRRVVPFLYEVPRQSPRRLRFALPAAAAVITLCLATILTMFWPFPRGISTAVGEQRLLTLDDGSRVFLNTATRLAVHYDRDTRRIELKSGEALFDVAKRPDWPFVVQVGDRQVTARGTSFVVRYDGDRTAVTLVEGKVTVAPIGVEDYPKNPGDSAAATVTSVSPGKASSPAAAAQMITLSPGQRLTIAATKLAQLDTTSPDQAIAWRHGQVILDDTPLADAVAEMNRYSPIKLSIERPGAADLLINGLFRAGDSMSFANAVAQTYGLHVVERQNEIALTGVPQMVTRKHKQTL